MLLRIEMNRGNGWEIRQEGEIESRPGILDHIRQNLLVLSVQYPHRALLNGNPVAYASVAEGRQHYLRHKHFIPRHARRFHGQ